MKLLTCILILLLILTVNTYSQNIDVPIEVQVPIFTKILSLERNLVKKVQNKQLLNIGVIYQSRFRNSLVSKEQFISLLEKQKLDFAGSINIITIDFSDQESLKEWIKKNGIDVLVLTPIRAIDVNDISQITKKSNVISFSLVAEFVKSGISIGIETKSDKPQIVINLSAAKLEGCDFNSHLLKLVRVIN